MALKCHNLTMRFGAGPAATTILDSVSLEFAPSRAYALMGPSGSGKTTLLSILGCLLSPSQGEVQIDGRKVNFRRKGELTRLRRQSIGFVFQHAQLLPFLTIEENLLLTGRNAGLGRRELRMRTESLLRSLDILKLRSVYPSRASGGERQRVAIARAMLHRPRIILADEPTAALDWTNGRNVAELLTRQTRSEGAVLLTVTHDQRLAELFDEVFHIDSGRVSVA